MLDNLEENRYPFVSLFEFIFDGYWSQLQGVHFTFSWIFFILVAIIVFRNKKLPIEFRFSSLYFFFTLYTNPAFDIASLKIGEVFGVLAILVALVSGKVDFLKESKTSPIFNSLILVFVICVFHNFFVSLIYPEINEAPGALITRISVTAKIAVLAGNILIIGQFLTPPNLDFLVKGLVSVGVFALLIYLWQGLVLLSGTLPYGTYIDAGFVGVPSFGSVSIERGHFGKFMAPLFPFFLYTLLKYRWKLPFVLLCFVTLINISASSQVFFVVFCVLALIKFRSRISGAKAILGLTFMFALVCALLINYWEVFNGIVDKIYSIAINGDESSGGGRSIGLFIEYLSTFPLGIGYSGSSLRTAPGLGEINSGLFAFISQLSLLSIVILVIYFNVVRRTLRRAGVSKANLLLNKCLTISIVLSILIFYSDILWFVPTMWLSFEMIWAANKMKYGIFKLENA
ncbi:hypothetical protein [Undibacterium sp. SXout20W]|uniref:hypothetical protein n=1 Tax=Undibacterium sp. SXout20W TaxID=3413051 RepID=UPI003BF337AF